MHLLRTQERQTPTSMLLLRFYFQKLMRFVYGERIILMRLFLCFIFYFTEIHVCFKLIWKRTDINTERKMKWTVPNLCMCSMYENVYSEWMMEMSLDWFSFTTFLLDFFIRYNFFAEISTFFFISVRKSTHIAEHTASDFGMYALIKCWLNFYSQ